MKYSLVKLHFRRSFKVYVFSIAKPDLRQKFHYHAEVHSSIIGKTYTEPEFAKLFWAQTPICESIVSRTLVVCCSNYFCHPALKENKK